MWYIALLWIVQVLAHALQSCSQVVSTLMLESKIPSRIFQCYSGSNVVADCCTIKEGLKGNIKFILPLKWQECWCHTLWATMTSTHCCGEWRPESEDMWSIKPMTHKHTSTHKLTHRRDVLRSLTCLKRNCTTTLKKIHCLSANTFIYGTKHVHSFNFSSPSCVHTFFCSTLQMEKALEGTYNRTDHIVREGKKKKL